MNYQNELKHYGILRKSGRYPWGSGDDAYGRSKTFYSIMDELKAAGIPEKEIATAIGLDPKTFTINDIRSTRTIAKEQIVLEETQQVLKLRAKGVSPREIARILDISEPTVRNRLKNSEKKQESALRKTAEVIRKNVDEHEIVDIGLGVEHQLKISPERLKAAVALLRDEGYETYNLQTKQPGTTQFTNQKVIVPPGTGFGNAKRMTDKIHTMGDYTEDNGLTYLGILPPKSVSSKRLMVKYDEDGGTAQDGMIHVRPGVKDLDMGKNTYAQVRILVDGTHYIKGMAIRNPDLPDGVDMVFHTNKKRGTPVLGDKNNSVLKPIADDENNPFGSSIKRQISEIDPKTGKERAKSALNLVNEEGDWDVWRKSLPSQMLAKQPHDLIKSQLGLTRDEVRTRLAEINSITNPVVKKKALADYADQIDSDAVDLRAAAMPRQKTQVIIPMPKMNKNEIYAPRFETGEKVVLIRYPHGGRFEIPEVTVNNNNRAAKKLLGDAYDAIGIHPSVAERLSGADFDGDTVVVIPNRTGKIKGVKSLGSAAEVFDRQLKNFDPKHRYGGYEEKDGKGNFKLMKNTGLEMGMITNLITDMSIQQAQPEHIVRAVKHSMVVIDAEKHKLNYRQSELDHGIHQLKTLYQGNPKSGAKTLLSRATAKTEIPEQKLRSAKNGGPIDKKTGALVYEPTGRMKNKYDPKTKTYTDEKVPYMDRPKKLALTDDAFDLVRDPNDPVERMYASHANEMKALANKARLQADRIANPAVNRQAKEIYRSEVDKLVSDLKAAEQQRPLQRRADVIAGAFIKARRQDDPTLREDRDRLKKVERQARAAARARLNITQPVIEITDRQWDAIQSGAVSASRLSKILKYADPKRVEELSMPRKNTVMTRAVLARAKAMLAAGATNADVAAALGVSQSTLRSAFRRGDDE